MSEVLMVAAIVLAASSGMGGFFSPRYLGERFATGVLTLSGLLAVCSAVGALGWGWSSELSVPWAVPMGRFAIRMDAISAMFVLQIATLSVLGSWYGLEYWPERGHPDNGLKLRVFYGVVSAALLLLVVSTNGVLFLMGWELMALAAFLLVTTEDGLPSVRTVGFVYLVATRGGTLCLFAMFACIGAVAGTFEFAGWSRALQSPLRDVIFVLALCGFGLKAGLMPLHIWLPGAHASAPSHVSALMSGVLIKTGIYGLVRLTSCCPTPPPWWGYVLIALGTASGVLGVVYAIGQHDLKRLLAYHSVENIGIICIGLGVAVLGRALGQPALVALGLAGALLHVWNHGLFKALLFFGAGSVLHATGTREVDRLGGLLRRMPYTGFLFLVGAVAICGLPPLNGLVSELFVYMGLFHTSELGGGPWLAGVLAAPALALVGALALSCFVKVFGAVFLGVGRSPDGAQAHEAGLPMLVPMALLAAACLFIGVGAPLVAYVLDGAVEAWMRAAPKGLDGLDVPKLNHLVPLGWISGTSAVLLGAMTLVGVGLTRRVRHEAPEVEVGTWDCGYAAPTARMQYTASSFAQMLVGIWAWALQPTAEEPRLEGTFPQRTRFHSHVPDAVLDRLLSPSFALAAGILGRLRPLQQGSIHLYLLYILLTLVLLLLWR